MAKKILLVDDDITLREMYEERLKLEGYAVATATNGEEALAKMKSFVPDLILLDIMMPVMNGFTVLDKLRAHSEYSKIPVLFLTALVQDQNKNRAMKAGAAGYIVKSETMPGDLMKKIKGFV